MIIFLISLISLLKFSNYLPFLRKIISNISIIKLNLCIYMLVNWNRCRFVPLVGTSAIMMTVWITNCGCCVCCSSDGNFAQSLSHKYWRYFTSRHKANIYFKFIWFQANRKEWVEENKNIVDNHINNGSNLSWSWLTIVEHLMWYQPEQCCKRFG